MSDQWKKLFSSLQAPEPAAYLKEAILLRIRQERLRQSKRRIWIWSVGLVASLALFGWGVKMMLTDINQTGFTEFLSLAYTDFGLVASYWQNYLLSLLETLPLTSLIIIVGTSLAILESLKLLWEDLELFIYRKRYYH
jgi:hypothetical protein